MSTRQHSIVQKEIDATVLLLNELSVSKDISPKKRGKIKRLISKLQKLSRSLPETETRQKWYKSVLNSISRALGWLFNN